MRFLLVVRMSKLNLVPAEWMPQKSLWTAWPSHPELWLGDLLARARGEVANMVNAIAEHQPFYVVVYGDDAVASAKELLSDKATIVPARFGDIWLRDTGPIFTADGRALRFHTNGWGEKFIYEFDDEIGDTIANACDVPIERFDFVLEGGAIEHNGKGAILTTRECVLNKNRNGWAEADAEAAFAKAFNCQKIIWLDNGLAGDHTDGHIDNLARFVGENTVLCHSAFGDDDPNAALYEKTAADLRAQGVDVVQIPSPGLVHDDNGNMMPASHMNFIISNKVIVVPTYGTASADEAVAGIAKLFPNHRVIGSPSNAILTGGGSFHCITQQEIGGE